MNLHKKYMAITTGLAIIISLATTNLAFAHGIPEPGDPVPITVSGTITDHGKPVAGLTVVLWCGGLDWFGGWTTTAANGWFEIHTNGRDCPMGADGFLEIFHNDSSVGFAFADVTIHTQNTVNVKLEDDSPETVPEFGWIGGIASLVAGAGALTFSRRRFAR